MTSVTELSQSGALALVVLNVYLTCGTHSAVWLLGLGTYLFLKAKPLLHRLVYIRLFRYTYPTSTSPLP